MIGNKRQEIAKFLRDAANYLETLKIDQLTPSDHQADLFYRLWKGIDLGIPYEWHDTDADPGTTTDLASKLINAVPNDMTFTHKSRRENAQVSIPLIIQVCRYEKVNDLDHIAYIMATTSHESAFAPVEEIGSTDYFSRYENRIDLGNTKKGDGKRFKGRGYVQITGRKNYTLFSKILGIDLVNNPEIALDPNTAAIILVKGMKDGLFTGRKLADYNKPTGYDFVGARAIVNGSDQARLIANYAKHYRAALS